MAKAKASAPTSAPIVNIIDFDYAASDGTTYDITYFEGDDFLWISHEGSSVRYDFTDPELVGSTNPSTPTAMLTAPMGIPFELAPEDLNQIYSQLTEHLPNASSR